MHLLQTPQEPNQERLGRLNGVSLLALSDAFVCPGLQELFRRVSHLSPHWSHSAFPEKTRPSFETNVAQVDSGVTSWVITWLASLFCEIATIDARK